MRAITAIRNRAAFPSCAKRSARATRPITAWSSTRTSEAIVTIGAKDALAHLLFATVGPGDVVVSPNPAYPIHQYGVIMAEGQACMLPMPDAATFLDRLEDSTARPRRSPRCC